MIAGSCRYAGVDIDVSQSSDRFPGLRLFNIDDVDLVLTDITLMLDVIEHIEGNNQLKFIRYYADKSNKCIVNIPVVTEPEQIVDRQVNIFDVIRDFNACGFKLKLFENWSVNPSERYQYAVFEKK